MPDDMTFKDARDYNNDIVRILNNVEEIELETSHAQKLKDKILNMITSELEKLENATITFFK